MTSITQVFGENPPPPTRSTGPLPDDPRETLGAIGQARRERALAEARELELAAHFADLCTVDDPTGWLLPGAERMVRIGADGTPKVAEFGTLELAAALGIRDVEAHALVRDALDLRHRLPKTWASTLAGTVPVWRARRLARALSPLPLTAAREVDRELSGHLGRMAWTRLEALAEGLVLKNLDEQTARERHAKALDRRGVWVGQSSDGISNLEANLDAADAIHLEATIVQIAGVLEQGGNTGGRNALRAQALGLLAIPARALQLQQASILDELPDDAGCPRAGQKGHTCGSVSLDPEKLMPKAELVVHLTGDTLATGVGVARAEKVGPILAEWAADLLEGHRVTVRPVLDAGRMVPSDSYECPDAMRRGVELRNPFEVFPWSTRRSTGCNLDHTIPWDDQSPDGGQTHPDNLGPLSRRVHRAKTHGGWQLSQPVPGTFLWRSPLGFHYLVTASHTYALDPPIAPPVASQPQAA